ncbi:unnamed protein product [Caenorhabditis auriculariae]|uniref:Paired domain-containing protein n=1 Tax=Caenorhabditis auriculariae TaxID=2777116 RepID=A0A8S1HLW4_9PELO|nr:unnamed protein product [Caenorhabditis auriculariae]
MFTAFAPTTNFGSIFPPTPSFPLNLLFPTPFLTAIQQHNEELFLKKRKRLLSKSPLPPTKRYADAQAAESPECSASSLAALEKLSQDVTPSPVDRILDCEARRIPSKVALTSRNRYGRPYISGRPLLTCDRLKIVECFRKGMKKIHIAKQLGITHSCVSKNTIAMGKKCPAKKSSSIELSTSTVYFTSAAFVILYLLSVIAAILITRILVKKGLSSKKIILTRKEAPRARRDPRAASRPRARERRMINSLDSAFFTIDTCLLFPSSFFFFKFCTLKPEKLEPEPVGQPPALVQALPNLMIADFAATSKTTSNVDFTPLKTSSCRKPAPSSTTRKYSKFRILESNGSSSMASFCAGSLALMDAGVPRPRRPEVIGLLTDPTSPD